MLRLRVLTQSHSRESHHVTCREIVGLIAAVLADLKMEISSFELTLSGSFTYQLTVKYGEARY